MNDLLGSIIMIAIGALLFGFMFYSFYLMLFSKHKTTDAEQATNTERNPLPKNTRAKSGHRS